MFELLIRDILELATAGPVDAQTDRPKDFPDGPGAIVQPVQPALSEPATDKPEDLPAAPVEVGSDAQPGNPAVNGPAPTNDDDNTPVLVHQTHFSNLMPNSMMDPPFRKDRDPPKSIDDPVVVATIMTSPLAEEYLVFKLWDIGAQAVIKVVNAIAEHANNKKTNALKDYYNEIVATVTDIDKAVKSWMDWAEKPRTPADKASYGNFSAAGTTLSRYEVFVSNLQTLKTFRNDDKDDTTFSSKWRKITIDGAKQADLQAAITMITTYQSKAQEVCNFVKTCIAMMSAGLSEGQNEINSSGGHITSATNALTNAFEEDPLPPANTSFG